MPDNQYLSIGEVLGLLLEDFPDVTISKIRFLESQGLIEPERTPSGYRKFYDHDVDLLRAILHEQKANFLPLKVIRDRIESGTIEGDPNGARTPPRGIRNVDVRPTEMRDSVFRRTDGGPEWAHGHALIPGDPTGPTNVDGSAPASPITSAIPVIPPEPTPPPAGPAPVLPLDAAPSPTPTSLIPPVAALPVAAATSLKSSARAASVVSSLIEAPPTSPVVEPEPTVTSSPSPSHGPTSSAQKRAAARSVDTSPAVRSVPFTRDELCTAAGVTVAQLADLEAYGIVASRGSGADATFTFEAVEVARVAGRFLAQGIDGRHLRGWRQSAEREAALFEQRIMPLLRQRNPQSRQAALDSLTELADLGSQLRSAIVDSLLRHHFDGS